jgi:uncharacterized membrane protein YbaN (DUF454 family)
MKRHAKRIAILSVGISFLALGLIGLFLPFLQGILFLIIGLILISLYVPEIRKWIKTHTEKRPHLSPIVNKIETWIIKFVGEI